MSFLFFPQRTGNPHLLCRWQYGWIMAVCLVWIPLFTSAQVQTNPARSDSLRIAADTTQIAAPPTSDLRAPLQFSARDSIRIHLKKPTERGQLFGQAQIQYERKNITAYQVLMDFQANEILAEGVESDSGYVGQPTFSEDNESFTGKTFAYNLQTGKGRVTGGVTEMQDGYLRAQVLKTNPDSTIHLNLGIHTTCDIAEHGGTPHYGLHFSRAKVDGDWVYTGPLHLRVLGIPLPVWLPFGVIPGNISPTRQSSGFLPPEDYGQDERGLYLTRWGYYWAISDYMDLQMRFGFWTGGSWQANPFFRYNKRYGYSGSINFDYVFNKFGERGDPNLRETRTTSFRWSHRQQINPTASLNGNVNLSTSNYLRTLSNNYNDQVRQTISSDVTFRKNWTNSGRTLTVNLRQSQTVSTGVVEMTLPDITFTQRTTNPFKRKNRSGGERWYEKISYGYTFDLDNRYRYTPRDSLPAEAADVSWFSALLSPSDYEAATGQNGDYRFDFQGNHRIPINATFNVGPLSVNPNVTYTEDWHLRSIRQTQLSGVTTSIRQDTLSSFTAIRRVSAGVGLNTEFYGTFPVKLGHYQNLRHIVRPRANLSFQPDYTSDFWGYFRDLRDENGNLIVGDNGEVRQYAIITGIPSHASQTLSFGIGNVFQTKDVRTDSTGQSTSKIVQLLTLDVNSSYDFAADSLKLRPFSLSARTKLFDKIDINASASFDPYQFDVINETSGRRVNRFVLGNEGLRLARLTRFSATARGQFRSSQGTPGRPALTPQLRTQPIAPIDPNTFNVDPNDPVYADYYNTPTGYVDFNIPWSLNWDITYRYNKAFVEKTEALIVNARFDFSLTPNWKINGATGYDFIAGEVVTTNISIIRDLHCWEASLNLNPFGRYQSFRFTLRVKTGHLRDILKLNVPRNDLQGRLSSFL